MKHQIVIHLSSPRSRRSFPTFRPCFPPIAVVPSEAPNPIASEAKRKWQGKHIIQEGGAFELVSSKATPISMVAATNGRTVTSFGCEKILVGRTTKDKEDSIVKTTISST
jgi:hypothetical protein